MFIIKIINETLNIHFFPHTKSSISTVIEAYRTTQFGPTMFPVIKSHMWPVATNIR